MKRALWMVLAAVVAAVAAAPVLAQDKPVYRCPGPPVLYTDAVTPAEAREKGCRTIEGTPITIVPAPARRPAGAATGTGPAGTAGASAPVRTAEGQGRIDPAEQRARDTDARRILADELQREDERLSALKREFNGGEPERRGDERNYQRYLDRVADLRTAIARKEADVAAIRREIGKLPQ